MDIPKYYKFFMFMGLSFLPITLSFVFFDYSCLDKYKIIKEFYPYSLLAVAIFYTIISLFFRLFLYVYIDIINIKKDYINLFEMKWDELLYMVSAESFIYGAIPFIITLYQKNNVIGFMTNSAIVWVGFVLVFTIVKLFFLTIKWFKK